MAKTRLAAKPDQTGAVPPDLESGLLDQIQAALETEPGNSVPPGFAAALFGHAAVQDLAVFDPADLAEAARSAFAHLASPRSEGAADIRLSDVVETIRGRPREMTIVEIINDNRPYLLDSTLAELSDRGLEAALVLHPILAVERAPDGRFERFAGEALAGVAPAGAKRESLIQIHLDRLEDGAARTAFVERLAGVYENVHLAVTDWTAMRSRLNEAVEAYRSNPPPLPADELAEAVAFLAWIEADNFIFLGMREYRYPDGDAAADPIAGTGLGIMRDPAIKVLRRGGDLVSVTSEVRDFLGRPVALIITKANVKSLVHRRTQLDYIGVKLFSADGRLQGELRMVGLFTSNAYNGPASAIPYVRHKIANVLKKAGLDPASYSGRALQHVLENYPRDELFQVDAETLSRSALAVMTLYDRPRVRVLVRPDAFDRFVSILVYIPKDRYDTLVRRRVGEYLAHVFEGRVSAAYPAYPEGPLARTHYIIGRDQGRTPKIDEKTLEAGVMAIVRTWADALREALADSVGSAKAHRLMARYGDSFSGAYREGFSAQVAIADIAILETLSAEQPWAVDLVRRQDSPESRANLKVFARGAPLSLSFRVPVIENLGFVVVNERTYRVMPAGATDEERVWLHDMTLERPNGEPIDVEALQGSIEAALMAVFRGEAESDGYNKLVVEAGLDWRDVALIRTLSLYLRQARISYSQDYMWTVLARHSAIAAEIVALFHARFDPRRFPSMEARAAEEQRIGARIDEALAQVASLDEDRILRRFVNLVRVAVRTTFFQKQADGKPHPVIALKFESRKIDNLPAPRPLYEVTVYSPRVEGVHLRFGMVARGGLRWSDRPQDFRTEILGLAKAQQVKNAVIVPVGAKGGFVPKKLPPASDRQAWLAEGIAAYKIFVGTLLDLTDNLDGGKVVPPQDTVRHDGDDPYLVVAADKGTATFSDIANAVSAEHNYWLGDAFASGGSVGYDHKKMGITAKGAWEAVKRHFREVDHDIQTVPFTTVGIGDMSGDVFGNGMLLSPVTKLVAAFDHRDIFLDPTPDPATAMAERRRLFELPRSSWQDYDKSLISKGGGVFSRSAKSIPISAEVRAALGFDKEEASPAELMRAILQAPVDLLWFGGIGTYLRASDESDDQAGDRANDAIRITGSDLRCKVIGEGANLGCTQRGRIEAARSGVRLNTDAIDNSAGVNTSDIEVNLKIALAKPSADGRLAPPDRAALLASMTDDVAKLVLRNNYLQPLALSLSQRRGAAEVDDARRLMRMLEAEGRLDRAVEFLPSDLELAEREGRGGTLTRPELAVLLAYAKLSLHDALLDSDVPDDPYLIGELTRYFPAAIRERFPDAIEHHRLRREIVATQLANAIVNRGGPAIVARLTDETGRGAADIARAYALARDAFGILDLNLAIDALDNKVPGAVQLGLYGAVQDHVVARMLWFLRELDFKAGLAQAVARFKSGIDAVEKALPTLLSPAFSAWRAQRIGEYVEQGVPQALAGRIVDMLGVAAAPDAVVVSETTGAPVSEATATLFTLAERFEVGRLKGAAATLKLTDGYERLALSRALDTIDGALRSMAIDVIQTHGTGAKAVEAWEAGREARAARIRQDLAELLAGSMTQAKLTVASSLLAGIVRA